MSCGELRMSLCHNVIVFVLTEVVYNNRGQGSAYDNSRPLMKLPLETALTAL